MPLSRRHAIFRVGVATGPTQIYGPAIAMDQLANMQVGGPASGASNTYVSYRFKAQVSSTLVSVRWYCIDRTHPGYGGGTGGTIRMTIEADVGGIPSGTPLATKDQAAPVDDFQLYTFGSPASLTANTIYHLVFTNIDAAPITNFVSVDCGFNGSVAFSPRQPRFADSDWAALRKNGSGAWAVQSQYTPILQIVYGDGTKQGMGYMEVSQSDYGTISGTNNMVRERFTVTGGDRVTSGAVVRVIKASGSVDPLLVRLEDSGGTLIDSFNIPAASVATGVASSGHGYEGTWTDGDWAALQTLVNGTTYNLRLSCAGTSTYYMFVIRRGQSYSYSGPETYFSDGVSQKTTDGTNYTSLGRVSNENNCQVYFN